MTDKKPAAKKAAAPKAAPKDEEKIKADTISSEKVQEAPKDETPKDDPGTPSTEVLQEQKTPADETVEPKAVSVEAPDAAVTNVIHGNEYQVTPDRGYRRV